MDFLAINKATWDKRTATHFTSELYDVEGFKQGNCSLNPVGDINV